MQRTLVGLLVVAACGSSPVAPDATIHVVDARAIDAPVDAAPADAVQGPDLTCLGTASTATAPDPLPIGGTVLAIDHYNVAPLAGATVTVHRRGTDAVLATATSAADGSFAANVASSGAAVDAYLVVAAPDALATRIEPGDHFAGGENMLAVVATDAEIARWYADGGQPYVANRGALVSVALDCTRSNVPDSSIEASPAAPIAYYDTGAKHWRSSIATSTNGFSLVMAASAVTSLTPHWHATSYPTRAVSAPSGMLTLAVATPHAP